jgi:SET domain-containing protein 6
MDEAMLSINDPQLSLNKKHAVIVRLGEKRILNATLERSQELLHAAREKENGTKLKRKDGDQLENGHKTKKFKR